ncbi:sulfatase-like hydrolase/transferase [Neisseria gonorrhoeae]
MKQSARIKNMDQTLKNTLGICALLAFCFGAAIASGYHLEYEYGYRYSAVGALASVVFLLLLARGFPRVSSVVLLIYVGTTALYLPVGWLYGAPSYQIVGSILESNPAEAREFVGNLPGSLYFVQALFFIFGLTVWKYCVSVGVFADVKNYKRRSKIWLTILLTLILSCAVMEKIAGDKDWREPDAGLLLNIFDLYYDLASAPAQYAAKRAHILEAAKNEISTYALRSDYPWFTQRGDYGKSAGLSDRLLLPAFKRVLTGNAGTKPRLIVMHLMGSHSDFCTRLDKDARRFQYQTEKISCYVSTIAQTDKFLEDTVKILNENKESWSLVYFSDHGLMHVGKGGERTLTHGEWKRQSYGVPLVKISSDDTRREMIKVRRSAFNFLRGFGSWTGIETDELPDDGYDFWGNVPDVPGEGNNLAFIDRQSDDPAPWYAGKGKSAKNTSKK